MDIANEGGMVWGFRQRWAGLALGTLILSMASSPARTGHAEEFLLGGFEGDLSSPINVDWTLGTFTAGNWNSEFVPTEVTEGSQAIKITHNANQWEAGLVLSTPQLIELVSSYDTLEFDVSPSLDTGYRQVFAVMQGDGLSWAQTPEFNLTIGDGATASNHVTIDLSNPSPNNPAINWKQAAQNSPGTWWQLFIGLQGNDWTAASLISTTIDNVKFVRGSAAGNFDGDTDVDGGDFLTWQRGESPAPLSASDLADWRANYGAGGGSATLNAIGVPEPTGAAFVAAATLGLLARRRRKRTSPSAARSV